MKKSDNRRIYLIISMIITFVSCNDKENNNIDKYNTIIEKYSTQNERLLREYKYDSAYSTLLKLRDFANKTQDSTLIAKSLILLGDVNRSNITTSTAAKFLEEAISILKRHNNHVLLGDALINISKVKNMQGDFESSQNSAFEALSIEEKLNQKEKISKALNIIGSNLSATQNPKQALTYYKRALRITQSLHNNILENALYINIGVVYRKISPDSAKFYYMKVLNSKLPQDDLTRLQAEYNYANLLFDSKKIEEAESHYTHLYNTAIKKKFATGIAIGAQALSAIYETRNKYQEATILLNKSIALLDSLGEKNSEIVMKQGLIDQYRKLGKYKEMDALYKSVILIKDSLMNADKQTNLRDLDLFYQDQKKESANKQLGMELKLAKLTILFWIITSVISLALLGFLIYTYKKNLKEKHRSLQELERKILAEEKLRLTSTKQAQSLKSQIQQKQVELQKLSKKLELLRCEIISDNKQSKGDRSDQKITLTENPSSKTYWENLTVKFNIIYPGFIDKLRTNFPSLNNNDIQFCLLIKLNMPLKDIANILNISQQSLYKRKYRLADKMKLSEPNTDLYFTIQNL